MSRRFNYNGLPFEEIEQLYKQGWGWASIAKRYGAPDHKSLELHALRRLPHLEKRDLAQAQRARRAREGASKRRRAARTQPLGR